MNNLKGIPCQEYCDDKCNCSYVLENYVQVTVEDTLYLLKILGHHKLKHCSFDCEFSIGITKEDNAYLLGANEGSSLDHEVKLIGISNNEAVQYIIDLDKAINCENGKSTHLNCITTTLNKDGTSTFGGANCF